MNLVDFLRFLFGVEGFIPALIAFLGTLFSFVFGKYIPGLPPEILQGLLALITIILSAWAGYNGGVKLEQMRQADCCK